MSINEPIFIQSNTDSVDLKVLNRMQCDTTRVVGHMSTMFSFTEGESQNLFPIFATSTLGRKHNRLTWIYPAVHFFFLALNTELECFPSNQYKLIWTHKTFNNILSIFGAHYYWNTDHISALMSFYFRFSCWLVAFTWLLGISVQCSHRKITSNQVLSYDSHHVLLHLHLMTQTETKRELKLQYSIITDRSSWWWSGWKQIHESESGKSADVTNNINDDSGAKGLTGHGDW